MLFFSWFFFSPLFIPLKWENHVSEQKRAQHQKLKYFSMIILHDIAFQFKCRKVDIQFLKNRFVFIHLYTHSIPHLNCNVSFNELYHVKFTHKTQPIGHWMFATIKSRFSTENVQLRYAIVAFYGAVCVCVYVWKLTKVWYLNHVLFPLTKCLVSSSEQQSQNFSNLWLLCMNPIFPSFTRSTRNCIRPKLIKL